MMSEKKSIFAGLKATIKEVELKFYCLEFGLLSISPFTVHV